MRFWAILGRFMARGCNPEAIRMNCFRIALNLQSSHNLQDCVMIAKNLRTRFLRLRSIERIAEDPQGQGSNLTPPIAIQGNYRSGRNPVQSERNLSELHQDYSKSRIQLQSTGLQISRSRLREDCDNPKELFLGIAGHREDCMGSQSTRLGLPSSLGSDLTVSR